MTSGALGGCTLKYAAIVTAFTIYSIVGASEGEAGAEMVKVNTGCRPGRATACKKQQEGHRNERYPGLYEIRIEVHKLLFPYY